MDWRIRRIFGSLACLVADLLFGLLAVVLGFRGFWLLAVAAAVAVLGLWNLNIHYRNWMSATERNWGEREWLVRHVGLALGGVGVEGIGALLLRSASNANSHLLAGVGVLLILSGLAPVVQVVRARLSTISGAELPAWKAWAFNLGLIVAGALLPALIVAFNGRGFWFGAAVIVAWLAAEVAERAHFASRWWGYVGLGLVVSPVLVFAATSLSEGRGLWVLLVAFGCGLVIMAGRQRQPTSPQLGPAVLQGLVRPEAAGKALALGLVFLAGGVTWLWLAVEGGTFPWVLFIAGIVAPVLFGIFLIIRGEGLALVVAVGLLAIWAVQDHTVAGGDSLPTGDDAGGLIVAFGDSYMSGEGTGEFITGTDVAGAGTGVSIDANVAGQVGYTVRNENECRRSPIAYPVQVVDWLGDELVFHACSGAKAMTDAFFDTVVELGFDTVDPDLVSRRLAYEGTENSIYGQLLRWEADPANADRHPDLLLVSLGGNDAGFSKIGAACFMPGSCGTALDAVYQEGDGVAKRGRLAAVDTRVAATLDKAVEVFPATPIVVIAYPQMFGPATEECGGQVPFTGEEIDSLRQLVTDLNAEVGAGIAAVNERLGQRRITHFAAGEDVFGNERFCQLDADSHLQDPKAMNRLAVTPSEGVDLLARLIPSKLIHNTFHPTVRGHDLVAQSLGPFLQARCWEVTHAENETCVTGLRSGTEQAEAQSTPTRAVVDAGARVGSQSGCDNLGSFVRCALVRSLRTVVGAIILLVLAGIYLALAADRAGLVPRLVGWLTGDPFRGAGRLAAAIPVEAE